MPVARPDFTRMAIRSVRLFVDDLLVCGRYYSDVMGFRHTHGATYVNGMGLCDVVLSGAAEGATGNTGRMANPLVTVAVSNLRTSKRLVAVRGGAVVDPPADVSALGLPFAPSEFAWCLASDPCGNLAALVHKFRRNSVLSFTLSVASVPAAARACPAPHAPHPN